jgi:hypothetical protein
VSFSVAITVPQLLPPLLLLLLPPQLMTFPFRRPVMVPSVGKFRQFAWDTDGTPGR